MCVPSAEVEEFFEIVSATRICSNPNCGTTYSANIPKCPYCGHLQDLVCKPHNVNEED
ncbi:MAG: hypothetical protein U9M89_03230 [Patescibacteria group bacterium]|nr:hypothetical protein [Patescibacteria group bacterium]